MIYLFNSAGRALYRANILRTLFLPTGSINEYRYRIRGDYSNVSSSFISQLKQLRPGEKTTIIFADRFAEGNYSYHPIRFGEYLSSREEDPQLFISVKLTDFVYPRDINKFNTLTRKPLLDIGTPALKDNNPANFDDGYYCVYENDIFFDKTEYFSADVAWSNIIGELSKTNTFKSTTTDAIVFMRLKIKDANGHIITPSLKGDAAVFNIPRNEKYQLEFTYRYPIQAVDQARTTTATIKIDDSSLRLIDDGIISIDSENNSVQKSITTRKYPEETSGSLALTYPKETSGSSANINFNITEKKFFWLQVLFWILIYSSTSVFLGLDWKNVGSNNIIVCKITIAFFQAIALLVLIRLIGYRIF